MHRSLNDLWCRKAELMGYLTEIFIIDNLANTLTDLLGTSMLQGIDDCIPSFLAIVNSSGHPRERSIAKGVLKALGDIVYCLEMVFPVMLSSE